MTKRTVRSKTTRTKTLGLVRSAKPRKRAPKPRGNARREPKKANPELSSEQPAAPPVDPGSPDKTHLFAYDGEVNPNAPLSKVIAAMFEATNAPEFKDPGKALMASVLCATADDCDLINGLNNGMDNGVLVERATFRLNYRAMMAVEIARRLELGELS